MYNPYYLSPQEALRKPKYQGSTVGSFPILGQRNLDGDSLLMLVLVFLLLQEGGGEHWPLILALLYCIVA